MIDGLGAVIDGTILAVNTLEDFRKQRIIPKDTQRMNSVNRECEE